MRRHKCFEDYLEIHFIQDKSKGAFIVLEVGWAGGIQGRVSKILPNQNRGSSEF